jgi:hypothetical protein
VDLDGVVADFYGALRPIAAEWRGVKIEELTPDVSYGLKEWGIESAEEYWITQDQFSLDTAGKRSIV